MGTGGGDGADVHAAARSGNLSAVQSILSSNPLAVNSRDRHSRTPLHLAAWAGHAQVVSYLCKEKADVGAAAMDDMGAIHFASQKGHLEVVRTLVSFGVPVKTFTRKGLTALHYAAQASHMELVKYLVKKGASPTVKTKAGKTPRDLASSKEIRLFLKDCEQSSKEGPSSSGKEKQSSKEGASSGKDRDEESDPKPHFQVNLENREAEANAIEHNDEQQDEAIKRKAEGENSNEASSQSKRARVALNHLLSADDTQEDENL
ncbi:hypothetical protein K2173_009717 [Erythroxylum novogranatense]|uniref:Uncharacterized protein n=1 Tax=Erythroxylum novogranatense TaxID=1862640 RepID=A0AAV8U5W7_9ROSI|nr:hypothetical protein K2173_009717 [Erythroxylum novogranatense]